MFPARHLLRRWGFGLALCLLLATPAVAEPGGDPAVTRFRQALLVDPDNPTLHYALGVALLQQGDAAAAIDALRKAYPAYTDSQEIHYNLGLAFTRIGDPDSALLYLDQAETLGALAPPLQTPLINALYNVALLYLEKDALDDAQNLFARVLTLDPQRLEILRVLGDIAARSGRDDKAIEYFNGYLQHYPDDQSAREYLYALHFNRAQRAQQAGETDTARIEFTRALELEPESPQVLFFLGVLDYQRAALGDAVRQLVRAYPELPADLRDTARSMLYNSALQSSSLLNTGLALDALAPLLAAEEPRSKDLLLAGDILLQRREFLPARERFLQVLALEPGNPKATLNLSAAEDGAIDELFNRSQAVYAAGDCTGAQAIYAQILAIRPDEPRALAFSGKCRKQLADAAAQSFAEAERALTGEDLLAAMTAIRSGLERDPQSPRGLALQQETLRRTEGLFAAMLASGEALLARDDFAAAEAQFKRLLELAPDHAGARDGYARASARRRQVADAAIADGNRLLDDGRLAEARLSYERAAALIPGDDAARDGLMRLDALIATMVAQELQWGRGARAAGELEQARIHFGNALALHESADIRRELAAIDSARNQENATLLRAARNAREKADYKVARRLYRKVTDSGDVQLRQEQAGLEAEIAAHIHRQLAAAEERLGAGATRDAIPFYRAVLELEPDNTTASAGLARSRLLLKATIDADLLAGQQALAVGDIEAAAAAFSRVLDLDPYHAEARAGQERIDTLRQHGVKPGDEQRLYLLGIEHYTRGRYAEAVRTWEQVLQIAPGHDKAKMNIEKAQRKLQSIREFQGG